MSKDKNIENGHTIYRVNDSIGLIKDVATFSKVIEDKLRFEGVIHIEPLAESRKELFEKIVDNAFDITSLARGLVDIATLHQEGTTVDYDPITYIDIAHEIKAKCEKICILADATDLSEKEYLEPLLRTDSVTKSPKERKTTH
jgi:hypothetical protein